MPTEIGDPSPAMGVWGLGGHWGPMLQYQLGKVSEVLRAATTIDHVTEVSVSEKKVEWREWEEES